MESFLLSVARARGSDPAPLLREALSTFDLDSIGLWGMRSGAPELEILRFPEGAVLAAPPSEFLSAVPERRASTIVDSDAARLELPLWTEGKVSGLLALSRSVDRPWTSLERVVASALADRVASMLSRDEALRERALAEAALVASEEAYRTIFKHSSEAIWVHDVTNGEMLDVNDAGCEMYGFTFDEMMEVGHDALLYPGSDYTGEKVAEYMGRTLAGESPRFEWMGRRKDGSAVWGEVTLRKVTVGGKPRILASARDITERKSAEEALRRANEELEHRVADRTAELAEANHALQEEVAERTSAEEALRASEEHFRRVIENASDLVMIVGTDGGITYAGPSSERILGYSPEQLVGMGPPELVHPDDLRLVRQAIEDIAAHPGKVRTDEFRVRHLDGSWRVLEMVGKTLSPDSAAEGFVANGRDVTERRRAEEELRDATEAAERANRAKSEFLSRMSHELRTPMNSILGFAQVLETSSLEVRQERCVQHILRAGRHLLQLINEVLQIAAIEAGRQNLSLEAVRVSTVLREAIDLARPMAAPSRIDLEYLDGEPTDAYVRADRQRLTQVVLNLLSNAVKYNRAGGRVRVGYERLAPGGEGRVRIRVEDTGHGVPPEQRADLFTPFARLGAENGEIEGTGLGLALSQRLTEAMGGSLGLERSGDSGSIFAIELDAASSPLAEVEDSKPARAEGGIPPHRPASILYVEDNLANLSLVETILWERPNWRTIPALQGQIGVELAREHQPDVVLLDLHLPDISGEEVLRRLRASPRTASLPVVVISADATPAATERLLTAGAAAFLQKPIDVQEFLDTLDRLLFPNQGSD